MKPLGASATCRGLPRPRETRLRLARLRYTWSQRMGRYLSPRLPQQSLPTTTSRRPCIRRRLWRTGASGRRLDPSTPAGYRSQIRATAPAMAPSPRRGLRGDRWPRDRRPPALGNGTFPDDILDHWQVDSSDQRQIHAHRPPRLWRSAPRFLGKSRRDQASKGGSVSLVAPVVHWLQTARPRELLERTSRGPVMMLRRPFLCRSPCPDTTDGVRTPQVPQLAPLNADLTHHRSTTERTARSESAGLSNRPTYG